MRDPLREVHAWRVHSTQHKHIHGSIFLAVLDMRVSPRSYQKTGGAVE